MKILIESYNNVTQNTAGGVQMRIKSYMEFLRDKGIEAKCFNKWTDKIKDYDLLHFFKLNTEDYQMMIYAKGIGKPIVISSIVPQEKRLQIFLNRLICKMLPLKTGYAYLEIMLRMADAIVAQTSKEANFINKNYKIDKDHIHIIPNGVREDHIDVHSDLIYNEIGTTIPYILQVGRFDTNKNQLSVIRAMSGTKIPVVFIGGSDPFDPEYFSYCKKEATENFHFLGWLENDDPLLRSAYQQAQVVVLPSLKEIFGNSLIEGGVAGANLVVTKELPIEEWGILDYCMTIDPHSINDIREVLLTSYNKPKNKNISKIFLNIFSWDIVVEKYVSIYENLIRKGI